MNAERWGEIKRIFDMAADLPAAEQDTFLHQASAGDPEIAAELRRLLKAHTDAGDFLETPVAALHDFLHAEAQNGSEDPFLPVGTLVAHRFEIVRFLDRGGMGEVYEARDTELNESVALKTIRRDIASNPEVIERFKQEVRHTREISHPNICRVHEIFCHDLAPGQRLWFLSMELLPGLTLRERIRTSGPLDRALALTVAQQLVSGLAAAHSIGVVHRDFKTGNVMLIPAAGGRTRAVITDFGLSLKHLGSAADGLAEPGGMGTPGYIAPEQKEDGRVGPLADQYALGAVFCEMLTGTLPCWSTSNVSASRNLLVLPGPSLPPRWEPVIRRCLQWDPNARFPETEDVAIALKPPGILGTPRRIAAAVLFVALLAGAGALWLRDRGRCRICSVVQLTPDTDQSANSSLTADGRTIVYSSDRADAGNLDIFLQKLPSGPPLRLTRDLARDDDPAVSPDGSVIAFRSERDGGGIYTTDAHGTRETLLASRGRNPQISPDGQSLLFWTGDTDAGVASGRIYLVPLAGGAHPIAIAPQFPDARFPIWSPDGRAILFSGCETSAKTLPGCSEWWVTSLDGNRLVNTHAMERLRSMGIRLSRTGASAWFRGSLIFSGGINGLSATLWTIPLDGSSWQTTGSSRQLQKEDARYLSPSISLSGSIAYTRISGALHLWRVDHASRPAESALSKITEDPQIDGTPFISEGGRWLVFGRGRGSKLNLWIRDNASGTESLLLSSGLPVQSPILDKSGNLLAYEQFDVDNTSIFIRSHDGVPRKLCIGCSFPTGWFDSDRALLFRDGLPSVIKMADPKTGEIRLVLGRQGSSLDDASWSPANEHLLFTETRGSLRRIFLVHLPRSTGRVAGPWIPVPDTGIAVLRPRWSGDGRTIFYISNRDGFPCIYGQTFSPEKETVLGAPFAVAHFHNQRASIDNVTPRSLNLSADGDSLFFNLGEQSSTVWTGTLARR